MHEDDPQAAELLRLLKRLQGEMSDLIRNIKEMNEKVVIRLERTLHEELISQEKRTDRLAHGQELPPEQGQPTQIPEDWRNQENERHLTPPR